MRAATRLASIAALLLLPAASRAAEPRVIEYLSVEANEGGSSGGHAALRFDDVVYHFQHHAPGVLRLHREAADGFLFTYRLLQNRAIAVSRIAVADDTYTLLRGWFNRRYLTEGMQFDALDAASGDRALIELLLRRRRDADGVSPSPTAGGITLRGTGYFFADGFADGADQSSAAESAPLVELRRRVQAFYGKDFLQKRSAEARATLTQLTPANSGFSFSRRYADLMTGLLAISALQRALPLQPDSFHAPAHDAYLLRDDERSALSAFAARLTDELLDLLQSPRPDWGYPLLVGMARLVALHESVRTGRLVFLDAFGPSAHVIPPVAWRGREAMMIDLVDEAHAELDAARGLRTGGKPLREADYTRLESASNRFIELYRGITEQRGVRVQSGLLLPSRAAQRSDLIIPARSTAELQQDLAAAQARERATAHDLQQRYAYNLITRNCVSEIFRGLNSALAEATGRDAPNANDEPLHAAARARLGGYLEPGAALTFIPFVSTRAVRDTYNVTATQELPSYRGQRLATMYRRENPFVVFLRESNTLTSTVYGPNPRDSFFVFFTDAVPTRPLLGAVNLAAGLGAGAVGLAMLPFDGGSTLVAGVKGALFSLPELAFVNLRKGTFDYIERAYRPLSTVALPAG